MKLGGQCTRKTIEGKGRVWIGERAEQVDRHVDCEDMTVLDDCGILKGEFDQAIWQ